MGEDVCAEEDFRAVKECLDRGNSAPAKEEQTELVEEVANSDLIVEVIWKRNIKRILSSTFKKMNCKAIKQYHNLICLYPFT